MFWHFVGCIITSQSEMHEKHSNLGFHMLNKIFNPQIEITTLTKSKMQPLEFRTDFYLFHLFRTNDLQLNIRQ